MREKIIDLLKKHPGQYVSGEEISKLLAVSRTAVWKHIKVLQEEGYEISALSKNGYRLERIPDKMLAEEIKNGLETKWLGQEIRYFSEVGSTNNIAKMLGDENAKEGLLVIAEQQNAGRGRLGRNWVSPAGKGLWFSLLLRPKISLLEASQLTIMTVTAIAQVLRNDFNLPVGIKWPNDLLWNGKKVAGILTEVKAEADIVNYVVLGIGINVDMDHNSLPKEIHQTASALSQIKGQPLPRIFLLQKILKGIEVMYEKYLDEGFEFCLKLWKEYNVTLGQEITITTWQKKIKCFAMDLDRMGGLIVLLPDGSRQTFHSGDVTLKNS
ncbi:biotin--[acetyl-CoA-carboxylase] ligase [Bacillota bacterium LX-D]|nr:biotin--[acetyl-CoA-carboxylase] ligase [Bacillota bacterium LX-D]